ncbi:hypothetical protein [Hungatella sp.]|uniref:hypothetical protein n=1 Tax=Hungatella sp. TaxID=2613924 RepID=UPI003994816C
MMKGIGTKAIKIGVMMVTAVLMLTGCRFGFASDPDDPNEVVQEEPIDTSVDTFEYDASLSGTKITLLNSKAEIQVALTKMAEEYEKKSGVHVEVMPVTDGVLLIPRLSACITRGRRLLWQFWILPM